MPTTTTQLAIVLLGTDVSEDGQRLSPQSQAIAEQGVLLAIENISNYPLIIASGGNGSKRAAETSLTEAELLHKTLLEILNKQNVSFSRQKILVENASSNTFENAINTLKNIDNWERENDQSIQQIIVVSWKHHSGRVKIVFQSLIKLKKKHFQDVRYVSVDAPFGKNGENSQKRLTSAFNWYVWNYLLAYEATILLIAGEFIRSQFRFKRQT